MKILITGGLGYIGNSLIYHLLNSPKLKNIDEIIVYDNLSRSNFNVFFTTFNCSTSAKINFVNGELLDNRKLQTIVDKVDIIYHLAAKVKVPETDMESHIFEQINNWGTANLVNLVERSSSVSTFVYLSSSYIYGKKQEIINEETSPTPNCFYGISKLRGEGHVKRLMPKVKTYILRSASVYGYNPSIRFELILNHLLFNAHFNRCVAVHGHGQQQRPFIHVDTLANILTNLLHAAVPSGTYNLVEHNLSIKYIINQLQNIYPDLEQLHINQHIQMDSTKLETPCVLSTHIPFTPKNFETQLKKFATNFAF